MEPFDSISRNLPVIQDAAICSWTHVKYQFSAKVTSWASYLTSGVIAVDPMGFMDQHYRAFGVILGILTFLTNFYFQSKASKR